MRKEGTNAIGKNFNPFVINYSVIQLLNDWSSGVFVSPNMIAVLISEIHGS